MATYILAALARREGWRAEVRDLHYEAAPKGTPDLVAISVWTATAPQAYEVADAYRARGIPVVLGGVHPSLLPAEALRHADAVVVGEAEPVLGRVLADAADGTLAGVYEGSWGGMESVPKAHEWIDLLDRVPRLRYMPRNSLQTTRGCRFNCEFCSVIRINGRGSRHRDPEEVVEELRVIARRGQRFGTFCYTGLLDDDLAADLDYTARLAEAIVASGLRVRFGVQASIGVANGPALVKLLARAGCRMIFTGFESLSRESLVECNKKNRPHRFAESIKRLHDHGIYSEGGFIFGFDHDDETVFDHTAEAADAMGLDLAHFSLLTPLPGTHTFSRMFREGRVTSFDWGRYDLYHAVIEPGGMAAAALEPGLWRAYHRFYARRPRLRRLVGQVRARLHPVVGTGVTVANHDYARDYRGPSPVRPSYVADPADLELLVATSDAPAELALATAVRQVPVSLVQRSARSATPAC